jgi:ribosomal protein L16/L10AE
MILEISASSLNLAKKILSRAVTKLPIKVDYVIKKMTYLLDD